MTQIQTTPVRRDAIRNRERLLRAAGQVFAERGLEAGVEEIAVAAGLGMGTLYRHFRTKEVLISALVEDILRSTLDLAGQAATSVDGSGLEQFLSGASALHAANRGCLPRLWSVNDDSEARQQLWQLMARLLSDAKRHGRVRPDLTETDITMILWSIRGVIETTGEIAPHAWRRHLSLLLAAMRPGGPALARPPLTREEARRIASGG